MRPSSVLNSINCSVSKTYHVMTISFNCMTYNMVSAVKMRESEEQTRAKISPRLVARRHRFACTPSTEAHTTETISSSQASAVAVCTVRLA